MMPRRVDGDAGGNPRPHGSITPTVASYASHLALPIYHGQFSMPSPHLQNGCYRYPVGTSHFHGSYLPTSSLVQANGMQRPSIPLDDHEPGRLHENRQPQIAIQRQSRATLPPPQAPPPPSASTAAGEKGSRATLLPPQAPPPPYASTAAGETGTNVSLASPLRRSPRLVSNGLPSEPNGALASSSLSIAAGESGTNLSFGSPSRRSPRLVSNGLPSEPNGALSRRPCLRCNNPVSDIHRCPGCDGWIHVFCGRAVGDEGFGQKAWCAKCDPTLTENPKPSSSSTADGGSGTNLSFASPSRRSPRRVPLRRSPRLASKNLPSQSSSNQSTTSTSPNGVRIVLDDGTVRYISQSALDLATIGTRDVPTPDCPYTHLLIFDSGWGGVEMVVALAKKGYACIVHLKGAHALFPLAHLEENLRGFPGGSHLEMKAIVDGVTLMAIGYKYNSKGTLYFLAPEGAATTLDGNPYVTKWPDEDLNVLSREVPRPALPARYFDNFNLVDKHNQDRQHELDLESNWPTDDPIFRISCTIDGMTGVDTMLAVQGESYMSSRVRSTTTKVFIEMLAEEMLENDCDGAPYNPDYGLKRRRSSIVGVVTGTEETEGPEHVLLSYGRKCDIDPTITKYGQGDYAIQKSCVVCGKKSSTYCSRTECKCEYRSELRFPSVCVGRKGGKSCLLTHVDLQSIKEAGSDDEGHDTNRRRTR